LLVGSKGRRVWSCERGAGNVAKMLENKAFSTESEIGRAKRRKKRIKSDEKKINSRVVRINSRVGRTTSRKGSIKNRV
jgi:hypothetical protein